VKYTWTTTENGDEITDSVHVHIISESGESEFIVVKGLPSDQWARDRMIGEKVHLFMSSWEEKKFLTDLAAEFDSTAISITEWASTSPPAVAKWLILFLAPESSADALLGDLDEMFQRNVESFGEEYARRKYWKQVFKSLVPWLKRLIVTVVAGYVRSKLGL
jgi:hypothetical protein